MRARIGFFVALLMCSVAVAKADQIPVGDPVVKTGGAGGQGGSPSSSSPAGIIIADFTILSPSGTSPGTSPCILIQSGIMTTSPECLFENDITLSGTGQTITELVFDAPGVPPNTVTCGFGNGSPFSGCGVDPFGENGSEISFFGGSIPFHSDFSLDFEGFPNNFSFTSTATTSSPEPGTLVLLLAGLGAGALLMRRMARAS